jgi:hypothetical protein
MNFTLQQEKLEGALLKRKATSHAVSSVIPVQVQKTQFVWACLGSAQLMQINQYFKQQEKDKLSSNVIHKYSCPVISRGMCWLCSEALWAFDRNNQQPVHVIGLFLIVYALSWDGIFSCWDRIARVLLCAGRRAQDTNLLSSCAYGVLHGLMPIVTCFQYNLSELEAVVGLQEWTYSMEC